MLRHLGAATRVWLAVARIRLARAVGDRPGGDKHAGTTGGGRTTMTIDGQIGREVLSWPGVTAAPHRFGGVEFRLGKRELGHLHGDYLADLPFPVRVREELVAGGRALPHHILPQSGWVSYPIRDEQAIPGAIALFRLAYDRATAGRGAAGRAGEGGAVTPGR